MPDEPERPADKAPQPEPSPQGQDPQEAKAPEGAETPAEQPGCPACRPGEHTEEAEQVIQADPATRSLARAMTVLFQLLKVVMAFLVLFFALECVTWVDEGKVGLVRRFGRYLRHTSGVHKGEVIQYQPNDLLFVWPAPIEVFEEVSLKEKSLAVDQVFWPAQVRKAGELEEDAKTVPVSESLDPAKDGYNLTGDLNVLHSKWSVRYRVTDPVRYQLAVADAPRPEAQAKALPRLEEEDKAGVEDIVREAATAVILRNLAGMGVDDTLYHNVEALFERINEEARAAMLDEAGDPIWGVEIAMVANVGNPTPPGKAQDAFDAVIGARSEQKKLESVAQAEAETILKEADSRVNRIRTEAMAYKADVISRAEGDAKRLRDILAEFPDDPEGLHLYLQQYRYDRLRQMLEEANLFVLRPGANWFVSGSVPPGLFEEEGEEETSP